MSFKTQKLRVATLFGIVMDNADHDGKETIRWLASRARRPRAPKNSQGEDVRFEPSFQNKCNALGYSVSAFMRGREHAGSIVTQINITTNEGQVIKLVETAKTDPKDGEAGRLKMQVRIPESLSESLIQQLEGQPLSQLVAIEGEIGDTIKAYTISRIYCSRRHETGSTVDATLTEDGK